MRSIGGIADREVKIRTALRDAELEERIDSCHNAEGYP